MTRFKENAKGETSLGGGRAAFPPTTWGIISRVRDARSFAERRADFEDLCRRYWKPVFHYVRIAWTKSTDDAKDLVQDFFLWLIEGDALARYAPERGSFRRFLKTVVGNFARDESKARNRLKRGGGVKIVPIDDGDVPLEGLLADARATDPEKAFDRAWAQAVAKAAIDRVRERFAAEGREAQFRAFEAHDLSADSVAPTYADTAKALGLKEVDVRNFLFRVRTAVRDEMRAELAIQLTDPEDLEEEWRALFGS